MLISLFKLEDVGPNLSMMVADQNIDFDQDTLDKFQFSGAVTYSLIFQGSVALKDISKELYGPFPFAFSDGFVQYAFSFICEDETVKDPRMKKQTLGLLLMLVPEMVAKLDDFRDELEKILLFKFHDINHISSVTEDLLGNIITQYNKVLNSLINKKQAKKLSDQIINFIQQEPTPKQKRKLKVSIVYPDSFIDIIRKFYANLVSSIPYLETSFKKDIGIIKTENKEIDIQSYTNISSDSLKLKNALIFVIQDVESHETEYIHSILETIKTKPKVAVVVSLNEDIEIASKQYAHFFSNLQQYISNFPFFSASFVSKNEFSTKMLEALFWAISPLD